MLTQRLSRLLVVALLLYAAVQLMNPVCRTLPSGGETCARLIPTMRGGDLVLNLGPLGKFSWKAFQGPMDFELDLILGDEIESLPSLEELNGGWLDFFIVKLPWFFIIGLGLGILLLEDYRSKFLLLKLGGAGLAPVLLALAVGMMAVLTLRPSLNQLTYRGPIKDAPRVLELVQDIRERWDGKEFEALSDGIRRLHAQLVSGGGGGIPGETIRLLLVSDFHNNPLGIVMARDLAQELGVDAVLDAGDFTDRGTAIEASILSELGDFSVPHLLVAGNHEDTEALEVMDQVPGVVTLDDETVEIAGITILGAGDPAASAIENSAETEAYAETCGSLLEKTMADPPDILLVHNPEMGNCVAEYAEENEIPLVFAWGHGHIALAERHGSVIAISAGTSGAGGLKAEPPYGFGLLSFDSITKEFVSACYFLYGGPGDLWKTSCTF